MKIHFAPLQGFTTPLYLSCHADVYGCTDAVYSPFVRVEKGEPRRTDITRLQQALTLGIDIIPQVVFKDVDEFVTLTYTIKNLGFQHIDLNLGCPYPMQTHRGRGAAMIGNIEVMTQVVKLIESDTDTAYSIKMRLGLADPTQWHMLMPVLNSIPLHHITVHPRIATQMYEGDIDHEQFSHIAAESKNPVVLNGDIRSLSDIEQIRENFPTTQAAMIGRDSWLDRHWLQSGKKAETGLKLNASKRCTASIRLYSKVILLHCVGMCKYSSTSSPYGNTLFPKLDTKPTKQSKKQPT